LQPAFLRAALALLPTIKDSIVFFFAMRNLLKSFEEWGYIIASVG
jgi:hypothetical protein